MKRQHGITVLKYTKGKIWLLVFPLIRGLISLKFDFKYWIKNAYLDIFVILFIFGLAWIRWLFTKYKFCKKEIYVIKGVIFKSEKVIPYSAITCAAYHQSFFLKPFKAVEIYLSTDHNIGKKRGENCDIQLVISEIDYLQIYKKMTNSFSDKKLLYKASRRELLLFSIIFSSALSGIIYIGVILFYGKRIVENKIDDINLSVISGIGELVELIKKYSETAISFSVILILIIASGRFVSFLIRKLHHTHFEIYKIRRDLLIKNGCFLNWKYYVKSSKINCVDLQQNLLMKITKTASAHISCTGYGMRKNELPVLVPMATKRHIRELISEVFSDFTRSNILLRTKKSYITAYVWLPVVLIFGLLIVMKIMKDNFSEWSAAINFFAVMFELPAVYLLAVKLSAKFSTGIGISSKLITVSYCRAYRFHTIIVPKKKVLYINIRRTLFQRISGCCDVIIYTRGERVQGHKVRGLRLSEANLFVENYDLIV